MLQSARLLLKTWQHGILACEICTAMHDEDWKFQHMHSVGSRTLLLQLGCTEQRVHIGEVAAWLTSAMQLPLWHVPPPTPYSVQWISLPFVSASCAQRKQIGLVLCCSEHPCIQCLCLVGADIG